MNKKKKCYKIIKALYKYTKNLKFKKISITAKIMM